MDRVPIIATSQSDVGPVRHDNDRFEESVEAMNLLIGGQWLGSRSGEIEEVRSPYDGSVVGTVPTAGPEEVEAALAAAERGAVAWRRTPARERMRILLRAAEFADERAAQIAATIS